MLNSGDQLKNLWLRKTLHFINNLALVKSIKCIKIAGAMLSLGYREKLNILISGKL